jgi:iduronate 2-sulfatase
MNLTYSYEGLYFFYPQMGPNSLTTTSAFRTQVRKAYAGAVSQSDFLFGQILNQLELSGLSQSTLVVTMSDHGFGLGENSIWTKNVLFDVTLRVPLMIRVPWLTPVVSQTLPVRYDNFFELSDLYPTVVGLLNAQGMDAKITGMNHARHISQALETGVANAINSKHYVFSVVARCGYYTACVAGLVDITALGFSVRSSDFRYTVWMKAQPGRNVVWDGSSVIAEELYDHSTDALTLLNFAQGASFDMESQNIVGQFPETARGLFDITRLKFEALTA